MFWIALWPILTRTVPRWLIFASSPILVDEHSFITTWAFTLELYFCGIQLHVDIHIIYMGSWSCYIRLCSLQIHQTINFLPWWVFWLLLLQCVKNIFKWPRVIRLVQQCDSGDPLGALGALQAVKSFFLFSSVSIILNVIIYRCSKIIIRAYLNRTNAQASVSHIFM